MAEQPQAQTTEFDNLAAGADQLSSGGSAGITVRSIIVGALLCVILSLAAPFNLTTVRGSFLAGDHDAPGALALFFILVAGVNLLLKFIGRAGDQSSPLRKLAFARSELLVIYVMLVVSSSLCTFGLGVQLPPLITTPYYYPFEGQMLADALEAEGAHFPSWMMVTNPDAARMFYNGLEGRGDFWPRFLQIVGSHWLKPLAFWAILLFAVYGAMICIAVIIRKQWMEREILIYPLTKVPLAMVEPDPQGRISNPLFRNKLFWMGFAIPAIVATLVSLRHYVPGFPTINPYWQTRLLEGLWLLRFKIFFTAVGFAFLINLEVGFSIWSFSFLAIFLTALMKQRGLFFKESLDIYGVPDNGYLYHVCKGALLAMVAYGLWVARSHLRDVFAKAFGRAPQVDDSDEILSYRAAVFGLIVCVVVMLTWLTFSGMDLWMAGAFLIFGFAIFYALTRIVAEGGLSVVQQPCIASTTCVSTFGSSAVGAGGMISMALSYVWAADMRTFVMAPVSNGLKVIEGLRKNRRRLVWAIFLAILITFVLSLSLVIYQAYRHGGITMSSWFFRDGAQKPYIYIMDILRSKPGPGTAGWALGGLGVGLMLGLLLMRRRYAWWPLHPIGLIVMGTYIMSHVWFSFFLAWVIKATLLKYGGPRLYTKAVPFFLGLIIGQFVSAGAWVAIDFFAGKAGNVVFSAVG